MCVELQQTIERMNTFMLTEKAQRSNTNIAIWWKDKDFRFVRYNDGMTHLLYPKATKPGELEGLTDWQYAQKIGIEPEKVEKIKNCCSFSDNYITHSKQTFVKFWERCNIVGTDDYVWLMTMKTRVPPESNEDTLIGVYGVATVSPFAERIINSGLFTDSYEKLSDSCYRILEGER